MSCHQLELTGLSQTQLKYGKSVSYLTRIYSYSIGHLPLFCTHLHFMLLYAVFHFFFFFLKSKGKTCHYINTKQVETLLPAMHKSIWHGFLAAFQTVQTITSDAATRTKVAFYPRTLPNVFHEDSGQGRGEILQDTHTSCS